MTTNDTTAPNRSKLTGEAIELLRTVRDQRFTLGLYCVHCTSPRVQLWGTFSGRQRYRCRACRRTFSDLTGTPMYRTKRLNAWPAYFGSLQRSDSIRKSALLLGVHTTTTFRWRHRFLAAVRRNECVALQGDVEVKTFRVPYSEKGARGLRRRPFPRGLQGIRWIQRADRYELALHACDRSGNSWTYLADVCRQPRLAEYGSLLDAHVPRIRQIIATGRELSTIALYASLRGVDYWGVLRAWWDQAPTHSGAHLHNVTNSIRRWQEWVLQFCGVATKYVPNYLAWRRFLDRTEEELNASRWVASGLPPPTLSANTA